MCCQIKAKCKNCGQKFEVTLLRAKMHGKGMCGHCKSTAEKNKLLKI